MTTYTKTIVVLLALALFGGSGVSFAQSRDEEQPRQGGGLPIPHKPLRGPSGMMGSTSPRVTVPRARIASTTEMQGGMRHSSSTERMMKPEGRRAFPGIVSSVGASSFTMTGRGLGNDHASTTFTVVITSSTVFAHGSSTISLANLTAGTKVEVVGMMATSTRTITAERVMFGGMKLNKGDDQKEKHQNIGQGGEQPKKRGFFEKMKNLFHGRSEQNTSATGGPAAVGSGGFLDMLFGWLQ